MSPTSMDDIDRISSLPEEVLSHILSLMPTKTSVRTSALSKRWRYTWTCVTNLNLNDYHPFYGFSSFSEFMDRVMERCKTPQLKLFRLGLIRTKVRRSDVSKWINEAVRLNVCEIDVHLFPVGLPLSLFTCKTLTKLKINLCFDDFDVFNVSSPVLLPGMKTLDLRASYKPATHMLRFIHGCPVLENLSLEISWPDNGQYHNFNIPTLKRFELRTSSYGSTNTMVWNFPNLEHLIVGGGSCPYFMMEDVSSLVEATVSFQYLSDKNQKTELLKGLSGVNSLTWSSSTLNDFVDSPMPKFSNLKRLELKGTIQSPWFSVIQILENTCVLKHLFIEEIKLEDSLWTQPLSVPICMLSNLRYVKIRIFKGRKCDMQFLEYMLGNAEVLKTLTITCGSMRKKDEMAMCARLLKFPRASRFCEIHFVGKWLNSLDN